ncbi:MAG: leucine-rich repeat protein [Clostridiales bacterium]|nr:leucine-rich repeat protein [Clostridiales bacterium]
MTEDGVMRIYGEGKMGDYNVAYLPWYDLRDYITSVVVESGVTHIGNNNFNGCENLTGVSVSDTVETISSSAFGSCTNITDYIVDENNTAYCSVDGVLFTKDKTELIKYPTARTASYTVPDSVTSLGGFSQCRGIKSAVIGGGTAGIKASAFMSCSSLTDVVIGSGITSIGQSAFYGCSNLTSVIIGEDVTSISTQAFAYSGLESAVLPPGITAVNNWTFGCSDLKTIAIPSGVKSIGSAAFMGCLDLTDVYYGGSEEDWNKIEMGKYNNGFDNAVIHYNSYEYTNTSENIAKTIITGTSSPETAESEYDLIDAINVLKYLNDGTLPSGITDESSYKELADADGNGEINTADAAYILHKITNPDYSVG